ncbi:sensory box histidine kinase [Chitinispirillum alkaliphilum]|nr:sensory box histidine kinase [Chitinispirillum alkaliphilum]
MCHCNDIQTYIKKAGFLREYSRLTHGLGLHEKDLNVTFAIWESGIPGVGNLMLGTQLGLFYKSPQDMLDAFVSYFKAGLAGGEYCVWVVSPPLSVEAAKDALKKGIAFYERYEESGQIQVVSSDSCKSEGCSEKLTISTFTSKAQACGLKNLRFACNAQEVMDNSAERFESGIEFIDGESAIAIYAYPEMMDMSLGLHILDKHKTALVKDCRNWKFLNKEAYPTGYKDSHRSETRVREYFSEISEGIACYRIVPDQNGFPCDYIFLEVNDAFENLTGLKPDDVIGKKITDVIPGIDKEPDWIGKYINPSFVGKTFRFECHIKKLKRWYSVSASSPQRGFLITVFSDITERKKTEKQLFDQKRMLDTVMANTGTQLAFLDCDFNVVMANKSYMEECGYTWEELEGKNHFTLFPHRENEEIFRKARDTGHTISFRDKPFEYANQPWRGITYWDWSLVPVRDESDHTTGLVLSLIETTERKKAEELLRKRTEELTLANRELESFSYSVSHDLRAPLRLMKGFGEIIMEDYRDLLDDTCKEYLQRIVDSAVKMNLLIEDLLNLAKFSRRSVYKQKINLYSVADSVVAELRHMDPARRVEISVQKKLPAFADPRMIEIVMSNLISNAWKYSVKNVWAHIEVGLTETKKGKTFFVRDNGAGFDMSSAKYLFKPFHRLHSDAQFAGTGIGLAIVEKIIHLHGGRIWATAEVGKGAVFYFTLPENDKGIGNCDVSSESPATPP